MKKLLYFFYLLPLSLFAQGGNYYTEVLYGLPMENCKQKIKEAFKPNFAFGSCADNGLMLGFVKYYNCQKQHPENCSVMIKIFPTGVGNDTIGFTEILHIRDGSFFTSNAIMLDNDNKTKEYLDRLSLICSRIVEILKL